jgi:cellobiose PTS system EIIC component
MNKLIELIERKLVPPLTKFAHLKYLRIFQKTFISTMSLILIGSIFLLVAQLPIDAWKNFLGPDMIAKLTRASGVGTQVLALYIAVATAHYTIEFYNDRDGDEHKLDSMPPVLLTIASFLLLYENPVIEKVTYINVGLLGAKAVFTAMIVSLVTVEIYRFFIKKKLVIKMPEGVPPMILESFMALIPSAVAIIFWWTVRWILNIDVLSLVTKIITPLISVGDSIFGVMINTFFNRTLWFVGIHGGNVVGSVVDPILRAMDAANLTAAQAGQSLPHIASYTFMDQYVWIGLAPLALSLMTAKSKHLRAIGLLALPAALFNIGEPLNFGVPIVLNPMLMIPSILSFVVVGILSYTGTALGLLPIPYLAIPWTVPAPIKAFLGTNANVIALIWILICWTVMFAIFYPFVKALDRHHLHEESELLPIENNTKVMK